MWDSSCFPNKNILTIHPLNQNYKKKNTTEKEKKKKEEFFVK